MVYHLKLEFLLFNLKQQLNLLAKVEYMFYHQHHVIHHLFFKPLVYLFLAINKNPTGTLALSTAATSTAFKPLPPLARST